MGAAFGGGEKINKKLGCLWLPLLLPQGHEDSEYVLSFEIGFREGSFYSAQTDRQTEPPSTALVYRFQRKSTLFYL